MRRRNKRRYKESCFSKLKRAGRRFDRRTNFLFWLNEAIGAIAILLIIFIALVVGLLFT